MKRILVGHIAVDTACVVLADPAVLSGFDSTSENLDELLPGGCKDLNEMHHYPAPELPFSREACWVAKSSRDRAAILGARRGAPGEEFGDGIAVSSGVGDGLYAVYALVTEQDDVEDDFYLGRVAAIVVDFEIPINAPKPPRSRRQEIRELAEAARTILTWKPAPRARPHGA